jgi:hypothetical protein
VTDFALKPRWDIFCKIVDNFGDIGVCLRLARQLHTEHGLQIRLWIDDLEAAQKIIPSLDLEKNQQNCDDITILKWDASADFSQAAEVVIEAFSCELPPAYLAAMVQQKSKWINLEYLSAENWVDDFHAKPSPQTNGLTRHFYFPGFTEAAGGLIREAGIAAQLQAHIYPRPLAGEGARRRGRRAAQVDSEVAPLSNLSPASGGVAFTANILEIFTPVRPEPAEGHEAIKISLFCYPNASIHDLLTALQANNHAVDVYVPASSILPQVADFFEVETITVGDYFTRENLHVHILPFLSQADYDALLRDCDLNFVRGEDSWVRAIWAGKPFIWQPYFQDENTHVKKLNAFLDLFYADFEQKKVVCEAHSAWLAGRITNTIWQNYLNNLTVIKNYTQQQSAQLAQQTDLAAKLVIFCNKI